MRTRHSKHDSEESRKNGMNKMIIKRSIKRIFQCVKSGKTRFVDVHKKGMKSKSFSNSFWYLPSCSASSSSSYAQRNATMFAAYYIRIYIYAIGGMILLPHTVVALIVQLRRFSICSLFSSCY